MHCAPITADRICTELAHLERSYSFAMTPSSIAKSFKSIGAFLKNTWDKEPVIFVSCALGLAGLVLPYISPYTKYSGMLNSAVPYCYPVPLRDDGNMPDIPAHPCEPKGPSLEWMKNL